MKKTSMIFSVLLLVLTVLSTTGLAKDGPWERYQQKEWATFQLYNPYRMEYTDTTKFKKAPPYTIAYSDCSISNIWSVFTSREYMAEDWTTAGQRSC